MTDLLVVDDNPRDHDRYQAFLAGRGLAIRCCLSGAEAFRLAADGPSPWRAVVLLWELPGVAGGPELLALCRRRWPEVPVIVVSGLLDFSRAARAKALGARDFLLKPFERDRFCEAVEAALR